MATTQPAVYKVLKELGAQFGADFSPDAHGVVTLKIGADVAISVEVPQDSAFIYFHTPVQQLAGVDRAAALESAMRRNLFGLAVSGAWLALDGGTDEVVLCYSAPSDRLDADSLAAVLEALAAAVHDFHGDDAAAAHSSEVDDQFIRV